MGKHIAKIAKHRVSFRELVDESWNCTTVIKSIESVEDALLVNGFALPDKLTDIKRRHTERKVELRSIRADRVKESNKRQAEMDAEENYRQNMAGL